MPTRPDEAARLRAGAAALGVAISDEQCAVLAAFLDLLERWNRAYNLTAVRDRDAMIVQHLLDCIAVIPPLLREAPRGGRLLDVGSGGGLPGVVIASLAPAFEVTCVDAVGKKAAFIRQAAGELALPRLTAVHARVQSLRVPPFDVIVSRAFASLADLVGATAPHLAPGGRWLAMKGQYPADEIAELPSSVDVFHVERPEVPGLGAERCLVWMRLNLRYPPASS